MIFSLNASVPAMHACGIENHIHAGDSIAQSKSTGKLSCSCCSSPLFIDQQVAEAVQLQVTFELI